MAIGCRGPGASGTATTAVRAPAAWPAPAADPRGATCADVGPLRVCWGAGGQGAPAPVAVAPAPLPDAPAVTELGWRCSGDGAARRCVDRALAAPPFACASGRCTQARPRLPDDGEWS